MKASRCLYRPNPSWSVFSRLSNFPNSSGQRGREAGRVQEVSLKTDSLCYASVHCGHANLELAMQRCTFTALPIGLKVADHYGGSTGGTPLQLVGVIWYSLQEIAHCRNCSGPPLIFIANTGSSRERELLVAKREGSQSRPPLIGHFSYRLSTSDDHFRLSSHCGHHFDQSGFHCL